MRAFEVGVAIVVLCGGLTACATSDKLSPAPRRAITVRMADLSSVESARVLRLRERTSWVGQAHHSAMLVIHQDVTSRRTTKQRLPKKGSFDYCRLLEKAGQAAVGVLDKHRKITRRASDQVAEVRAIPEIEKCVNNMSIFASRPAVAQQIIEPGLEPEVSGAYESYLDLLESQIHATDWSVAGVRAAVNNVLATATADGIPEGDLLALASFADLAESSAQEWNAYDWGSGGAGTCSGGRCLMSLFGRKSVRGKIGAVIAADVGGCLSHVRSFSGLRALLATPAWQALAGRCGIRAAITSSGAILALI